MRARGRLSGAYQEGFRRREGLGFRVRRLEGLGFRVRRGGRLRVRVRVRVRVRDPNYDGSLGPQRGRGGSRVRV